MSANVSHTRDWAVLRSAAQEMQAYLLSDQWAWPVRGDVRLTPGTWLLSCRRLQVLTDALAAERDELIAMAQRERTRWAAAWRKKVAEDAEKRLRLWRSYVLEMVTEVRPSQAEYAAQVQQRVMLALLDEEDGLDLRLQHLCVELDDLLHGRGRAGDFVWPAVYAVQFDRQQFWYLYYSVKVDE